MALPGKERCPRILAAPLDTDGLSRRGYSDFPVVSLGCVGSFPLRANAPSTLRNPVTSWESFHSSQNPLSHHSNSLPSHLDVLCRENRVQQVGL